MSPVHCSDGTFALIGRVEGTSVVAAGTYDASPCEHVVVTAAAVIVNLPAAPQDDNEVRVSCMTSGGGGITVSGNGNSIYAVGASEPLADDVSTAYRYIAALGQWKRLFS
jgi:hypothetical protein